MSKNIELCQSQTTQLIERFPKFELSYETISHKKVSSNYNICLSIPIGKKTFAWFTFYNDEDVCYTLELNKEKKITKTTRIETNFKEDLSLGTIVYGTYVLDEQSGHQVFIIEDIFYYKGVSLTKYKFIDKLECLEDFIKNTNRKFTTYTETVFMLPVLWEVNIEDNMECPITIPDNIVNTIPYTTHHIQYRACYEIMPYLNVLINRKLNLINIPSEYVKETSKKSYNFNTIQYTMDYNKPQYKYPTIFHVTADVQYDIYHLFAYGKDKNLTYYNIAYIPNYKTSVFMNKIFRKIRENDNLDYIEESDDEDQFQNTDENKYVDLEKSVLIECTFNYKFKRWTPTHIVEKLSKVVHINQLVRDYYDIKQNDNIDTNERNKQPYTYKKYSKINENNRHKYKIPMKYNKINNQQ
jgi:hypothetical protein